MTTNNPAMILPLGANGMRSYNKNVQSCLTIQTPFDTLSSLNKLLPAILEEGVTAFVKDIGTGEPGFCYYDSTDNLFKVLNPPAPTSDIAYFTTTLPSINASSPGSSNLMYMPGFGTVTSIICAAQAVSSTVTVSFTLNGTIIGSAGGITFGTTPVIINASSPNSFSLGDKLAMSYTGGGSATNIDVSIQVSLTS